MRGYISTRWRVRDVVERNRDEYFAVKSKICSRIKHPPISFPTMKLALLTTLLMATAVNGFVRYAAVSLVHLTSPKSYVRIAKSSSDRWFPIADFISARSFGVFHEWKACSLDGLKGSRAI